MKHILIPLKDCGTSGSITKIFSSSNILLTSSSGSWVAADYLNLDKPLAKAGSASIKQVPIECY